MNARNTRNKSPKKRRRKARVRGVCVITIMCSLILCCVAFGNMIRVEYHADGTLGAAQTPYADGDAAHAEAQQPKTDTAIADESAWRLLLVNPWNKVPENFSVELTYLKSGHAVDQRVYPDLQEMMDAARAEGLSPLICSSYRTNEKQQQLFDKQVKELLAKGYSQDAAEKEASAWVAIPGTSEHETGLAVDIVATSYQLLDENQAKTAEQKWLMENAYKFGFVLRYPVDKSEITGISYEPWHYRYVGKEVAKELYTQGLCLEEYLTKQGSAT